MVNVEGYPEVMKGIPHDCVILVHYLLRSRMFFARTQGDGYAMLIRAAYKLYIITHQTQVTHINIGGKITTCDMADMEGAIGVGKGSGNKGRHKWQRRAKIVGMVGLSVMVKGYGFRFMVPLSVVEGCACLIPKFREG